VQGDPGVKLSPGCMPCLSYW